jgi:hypothetical protein
MRGVGFLVVYLSWACGAGLVVWGARALVLDLGRGDPRPLDAGPGSSRWFVLGSLALLLGSLALPWIGGPAADGSGELVLSGWQGLDVLSLAGMVVLVALAALLVLRPNAGDEDRRLLLDGTAACLVGVVAGNALIQLSEPAGSRLEWGAVVSLVLAVLAAVLLARSNRHA